VQPRLRPKKSRPGQSSRRHAPAESRLAPFARHPAAYLAATILVLVPCYWQSRVQAGDLGSHIYNAWLVQLIARGQAPGLRLAGQSTNILFDWLLSALLEVCGAAAAQRIAVSVAVLVFFWGAFVFAAARVGRPPWGIAPALAMLSYGWIFHMGFFNFYLSLGLCFWAMALAWDAPPRGWLMAVPLVALAYVAHALPVVWTAGVLAYAWVSGRLRSRARLFLLGTGLAALVLIHAAIVLSFKTLWFTQQIRFVTGADQLWVFGGKYQLAVYALLAVWIWMAVCRSRGSPAVGALLPVAILTAAAIFLIPYAIWLPQYQHQLAYVSQRLSLPLAIAICAILAGAPLRSWQITAIAAVALLFFGFLYTDERTLNDFEDRLDDVVAELPTGQRVVLSISLPDSQVPALMHTIDRACVGRCWSYANYEPSSGQFRIRVAGKTSIVAATDADSGVMQSGTYVVKPGEPPLTQILTDGAGQLSVRQPPPGRPLGLTLWHAM
jgi:hypothetical protein